MQLKMLLTSRTIWRGVVFSAVAVLLVFKYVVPNPSAEAAASVPSAITEVMLGPSHLIFTPCWLEGSREQGVCGSSQVDENRQSHAGRQINIQIAVLPALKNHPVPDALFILAGGPGQAANAYGPFVDVALKKLHQDRDIVLIDQRGTGKSNPLNCQAAPDALPFTAVHQSFSDSAQACLAKLDIWGGSYGTRVALVYMKTHPNLVRAAVLDGVAPYSNKIPLYEARDAQ